MKSLKITHRIYETIFELLEKHPEGLRWSELLSKIQETDPAFHPKTVNGCVWKLVEKYPNKVYKPSKGLFRLLRHKPWKNCCVRVSNITSNFLLKLKVASEVIWIQFYNLKTKEKVEIPDSEVEVVTMENGRHAAQAMQDGTKLFKFISEEEANRLRA